jgi:hypothetical protein
MERQKRRFILFIKTPFIHKNFVNTFSVRSFSLFEDAHTKNKTKTNFSLYKNTKKINKNQKQNKKRTSTKPKKNKYTQIKTPRKIFPLYKKLKKNKI